MSIQQDVLLLIEAEEKGLAALAASAQVSDHLDQLSEALSQMIERMVLVRGNTTPVTLDAAIGRAEDAHARVLRIDTMIGEIDQIAEAAIHLSNTYKSAIMS